MNIYRGFTWSGLDRHFLALTFYLIGMDIQSDHLILLLNYDSFLTGVLKSLQLKKEKKGRLMDWNWIGVNLNWPNRKRGSKL